MTLYSKAAFRIQALRAVNAEPRVTASASRDEAEEPDYILLTIGRDGDERVFVRELRLTRFYDAYSEHGDVQREIDRLVRMCRVLRDVGPLSPTEPGRAIEDVIGLIYPRIVPSGLLADQGFNEHALLGRKIAPGLAETLIVAAPDAIRYLDSADLVTWRVSEDKLFERARANLNALPWDDPQNTTIPGESGARMIMYHHADGHAPARVLRSDIFTQHAPKGTLFACFPDTGTLVLFDCINNVDVKRAKSVASALPSGSVPISKQLYRMRPDGTLAIAE